MRARELALIVAAAALVACGKESPPAGGTPASGGPSTQAPAHAHEGKHGGALVDLGDHEGHLEVVHDAKAGTLSAWVTDADLKPVAVEAPVVNLTAGGVQVPMMPAAGGTSPTDAWTATHEALKADPLEGRIRVKIGDRTYQAAIPHAHGHPALPHGGELLVLGDGEYHLEMIHDHDGGNVTVYVLGKDMKTPVAVARPAIVVDAKTGPVDVVLTAVDAGADGTAETWQGSHAALRVDPWPGRIRLRIAGKDYESPLEGPAHSH
jgi:hypothetical protein